MKGTMGRFLPLRHHYPRHFIILGQLQEEATGDKKKETLGDPLHQFFLLADEATGRGCGLLGITLRVLL